MIREDEVFLPVFDVVPTHILAAEKWLEDRMALKVAGKPPRHVLVDDEGFREAGLDSHSNPAIGVFGKRNSRIKQLLEKIAMLAARERPPSIGKSMVREASLRSSCI